MEHTDVLECGRWWTAPLPEVSNISAGDSSITPGIVADGDKLHLFLDANTVAAYQVFIGYVPTDHEYPVECSVMSLARIDSFLCSETSIFRAMTRGEISGKRNPPRKSLGC